MTTLSGVFAGGDAVTGPATVIEAVGMGKRAAISIDRYLRDEPFPEQEEKEGIRFLDAFHRRESRLAFPRMGKSSGKPCEYSPPSPGQSGRS